jgi:hypothetical protein
MVRPRVWKEFVFPKEMRELCLGGGAKEEPQMTPSWVAARCHITQSCEVRRKCLCSVF